MSENGVFHMEKILIVDDEVDILRVIRKYLQGDYNILTAVEGRGALEIFKKEKPTVMVTDIRMPGMDGIELIRRVREMSREVEIIAITGHGDVQLSHESLRVGASDCLLKPIDVSMLEDSIDRALERFRGRRGVHL
jgi:YesN/AraC family two-component response regulator